MNDPLGLGGIELPGDIVGVPSVPLGRGDGDSLPGGGSEIPPVNVTRPEKKGGTTEPAGKGNALGRLYVEADKKIDRLKDLWFAAERINGNPRKLRDCNSSRERGQPINICSGLPAIEDPGFVIGGIIPIDLSSIYKAEANIITPVGRNRCTNIDAFILREADGRLKLHDGSFLAVFNQPSANPGHWEESNTAGTGKLAITAGENREFLVRNGTLIKTFKKFRDGCWRLSLISYRDDVAVRFERERSGVLTTIALPDGLRVEFDNDAATGYRLAAHLVAPGGERKTVLRYAYDERGNATEIVAPYSGWMRHTYDAYDRIIETERSHGFRARREYDQKGRVVAEYTNGAYNNVRFAYDDGLNTNTYLPFGEGINLEKVCLDNKKRIVEEANALGFVKRTEYNEAGLVGAVINAEGERTEYTYHNDGLLRSIRDGEGRETFYYHDASGNTEIVIDPEGNSWDYEHDHHGDLTAIVSPLGYRTDIVNNALGQPTGIMRHDGLMEQRKYDAYHRLASIVDFRGETTSIERDAFGRIIKVRDPNGGIMRFAYRDEFGVGFRRPSRIVRPDGSEISMPTRASSTEVRFKDGEGRITIHRYGFGPDNRLTEIEVAGGGVLKFEYDKIERLVRVRNQQGLYWTFERDAAGRVVRQTDFAGLAIEYIYDGVGRVIEARCADGGRQCFAYDKSGRLIREELHEKGAAEPEVTTWTYDGRGFLEVVENADAKVHFERDAAGRVIKETINGREVKNTYDCCGNRTEREIGGRLVKMLYDPLGAIKQMTIGGHAPLVLTRDAMGRETRRETAAGFHLAQSRDAIGRLTAQVAGLAIRGQEGAMAAQRAGIQLQEASRAVERHYAWSKASLPVTIADRVWGETAYRYDHYRQVVETRLGANEAERFEYDEARNIVGFAEGPAPEQPGWAKGIAGSGWRPPASPSLAWSVSEGGRVQVACGPKGEKVFLTYDVRGRVVERKVERDGFRTKVWRYGWDGTDRLVSCVTPDHETWHYGYDPFGRRLWKKRELNETERRYHARKFPQAVGRLDHEWHYSEQMPVKGISPREEVEGLAPVVGVAYQWDGNVIAEEAPLRLDGSIDWDKATRWHYEPKTFRPLAKEEPIQREHGQQGPGPTHRLLYIVNDHLSTPREMFAENGRPVWAASYTTWGRVRSLRTAPIPANNDDRGFGSSESPSVGSSVGGDISQANVPAAAIASYMRGGFAQGNLALKPAPEKAAFACPIRFQGQWQDEENGLHYNRFRYYDPLVGQYTSSDPIGLRGGTNNYGYARNNPINSIDPMGLTRVYDDEPFPGSQPAADGRRHYMDINDGQNQENQLTRVSRDDLCDEIKRVTAKLKAVANGWLPNRVYEQAFDTRWYSEDTRNYYLVEGHDDKIYPEHELNYIGIGMFEAWMDDSKGFADWVVAEWKDNQYGENDVSPGTTYWMHHGYDAFDGPCGCIPAKYGGAGK